MRQTAACLRQPGMVGNLVPVYKPQEIPQRIGIRAAPDNAALAVDPLEIADHVHAEIAPREQRGSAHPRRIIRLAGLFDESVEASFGQKILKTVVKHMAWRTRNLRPSYHEIALNLTLTTHRHPTNPVRISMFKRNQATATSSTRCYGRDVGDLVDMQCRVFRSREPPWPGGSRHGSPKSRTGLHLLA